MATQLAATPTVKGEVAKAVLAEMRKKPTEATKKGAKKLIAKFSKMVK